MEDNRSRRERRALATRAIEPAQLGLAGAAQLGCLHRQSGKDAEPEVEYLVTSRVAGKLCPEEFLNTDRQYWGVESGLHQRLDCSGFEDRLRVRHKGAVHILGLFARVGVAFVIIFAKDLYKPAKRQPVNRVFGLAPLKSKDSRREEDAKLIDAYAKSFSQQKMPKLVGDNQPD